MGVGGSGGDGGELGGGRGVKKGLLSRESTESEETTANLRLHICIHTLILPWPLGNGANPPFGVSVRIF